jgi:pilus assembly protein CpaB
VKASWALIAGLILGLVAVYMIDQHIADIEARQSSQGFLRLASEQGLSRGDVIDGSMLEIIYLPEEFGNLRSVALPATSEVQALILSGNAIATRDIAPGSFLLFEHITETPDLSFANRIGEGMRAVSIPVTAITSVSYFVGPGSRVDILATVTERNLPTPEQQVQNSEDISPEMILGNLPVGQERLVTKTLLQNVSVMAVDNSVTPGNYLDTGGGYSTVTFEVTPLQAELLTFALSQAEGGLALVLRNPADDKTEEIPSVGWENLE